MRYILVDLVEGRESGDNHIQIFDSLEDVEKVLLERAEEYEENGSWQFDEWRDSLQLYSIGEQITIDIRSMITVKLGDEPDDDGEPSDQVFTPNAKEPVNVVPLTPRDPWKNSRDYANRDRESY